VNDVIDPIIKKLHRSESVAALDNVYAVCRRMNDQGKLISNRSFIIDLTNRNNETEAPMVPKVPVYF